MDDGHIWLEILIIVLLVLANGVCSLAEIAIVGARKTKLQEMIDEGNKNAGYALIWRSGRRSSLPPSRWELPPSASLPVCFPERPWRGLWGMNWRSSRRLRPMPRR